MKHYMDIENLREFDVDLGNGMVRSNNCGAFEIGDHVVVQEKFDGSCASVALNQETGELEAFSRKQKLDYNKTLNGFWNYTRDFVGKISFSERYIYFGEWSGAKNKIVYNPEAKGKWYVFDIFDRETDTYLPWEEVKMWAESNNIDHVAELYDGDFKGWDHVKTFMNMPHYGDVAEGCVVKNQTKLNDEKTRSPIYLKLVNDGFKESMIKPPKTIDPEKEEAKHEAESYADQIVTRNRAEKILLKLRDEGVLPSMIAPKDMGTVAKHLPKRMYEDCVKEEPEIVKLMGEYGGKMISAKSMKLAKEILL